MIKANRAFGDHRQEENPLDPRSDIFISISIRGI
jgi:hypothetical protein